MGRPKKQTAEYFPHFVGESKTKFILESTWGNDGYAFWFKLLELLCKSDGHFFDYSQTADRMYLVALAKVSEEKATEILDTLALRGNIDEELWKNKRIIWCQSLVDNLSGMYAKRTTPIPTKPGVGVREVSPEPLEPDGKGKMQEEAAPALDSADGSTEPAKKAKKRFGEFVTLTDAEYEKLVEKFGREAADRMIETLDNAKGAKGYKYKSDYRAILTWVVDRVLGKEGGNNAKSGNTTPGGFKPSRGFKKAEPYGFDDEGGTRAWPGLPDDEGGTRAWPQDKPETTPR